MPSNKPKPDKDMAILKRMDTVMPALCGVIKKASAGELPADTQRELTAVLRRIATASRDLAGQIEGSPGIAASTKRKKK